MHDFFNKNIKITIKNYDIYSKKKKKKIYDEAKQTAFSFLHNFYLLIMRSGQEPSLSLKKILIMRSKIY